MTNLDRIKNMPLDELAELLSTKACGCCAYPDFAPCGFKGKKSKLLLVEGRFYEVINNVHDAPELLKK